MSTRMFPQLPKEEKKTTKKGGENEEYQQYSPFVGILFCKHRSEIEWCKGVTLIRPKTHWIQPRAVVSSIVSISSSPLLFPRENPQISTSISDQSDKERISVAKYVYHGEARFATLCFKLFTASPRSFLSWSQWNKNKMSKLTPNSVFSGAEMCLQNLPQIVAKNQHFQCSDIFSSGSWRVSVYTQKNHPWGV